MAERFNAAVLKTVVGSYPPGVRIPLSPPPQQASEAATVGMHASYSGSCCFRRDEGASWRLKTTAATQQIAVVLAFQAAP